jgi:AraC-like DNA-binding protein
MPIFAVKEGFKGQRILSFPEESIRSFLKDVRIKNLYITRIGFFPEVKYHYNNKLEGVDYCILIYCIQGKGWFETGQKKYEVKHDQFFILPSQVSYSFGANNEDPWSIYWIHFKGNVALSFVPSLIHPYSIDPDKYSRIQERRDMIEEIYSCLESGFIKEYYVYACSCLHHLLASFLYLQAFRKIRQIHSHKQGTMEQVIHYMKEHIHEKLRLERIAVQFHLSVSQFSFLFKQYTSHSPIDYFIRLKIQRACQYMDLTRLKVSEIALLLGFEDLSYFSRIFSKVMKMSPSAYRNHIRDNQA